LTLLSILRRRWVSIVIVTALGAVGAVLAVVATTPQYEANAQLILVAKGTAGPTASYQAEQGELLTQQLVQSLTQIVPNEPIVAPVIDRLGLRLTSKQLAAEIKVASPLNTSLINITVRDESQRRATAIAAAVARRFAAYVAQLQGALPEGVAASVPVVAYVSQPASAAGKVAPRTALYLAVGIAVGLLLGIALAAVLEATDRRLRSAEDLHAATGVPTLAGIALNVWKAPVADIVRPPGPGVDAAFRQLALALGPLPADLSGRSLALTSVRRGEGSDRIALGLCVSLARAGRSVALVEADWVEPTLAAQLGLAKTGGLFEVLVEGLPLDQATHTTAELPCLTVLTCGMVAPSDPMHLAGGSFHRLLRELGESAELVVVRLPAVLSAPEAALLAGALDGVVLVGSYLRTTAHDAESAAAQLGRARARLIGAVLSMIPGRLLAGQSAGYGAAAPWPPDWIDSRVVS
jgi:capsular polysaccharide biosynthesis protein